MSKPSTSFMERAACAGLDPEVFFPLRGRPVQPAKDICATCDVCEECKTFAIETRETAGVWGRTTGRERKRMRREQRTSEAS